MNPPLHRHPNYRPSATLSLRSIRASLHSSAANGAVAVSSEACSPRSTSTAVNIGGRKASLTQSPSIPQSGAESFSTSSAWMDLTNEVDKKTALHPHSLWNANENIGNSDANSNSEPAKSNVEKLVSQMHDLSFMLVEDELSIPENRP